MCSKVSQQSQQSDVEPSLNGLNELLLAELIELMGQRKQPGQQGTRGSLWSPPAPEHDTPSPCKAACGPTRKRLAGGWGKKRACEWEGGARLLIEKVGKEYPILF